MEGPGGRFWGERGGGELKRPRAGLSAREVGSGPEEGLWAWASLSIRKRSKKGVRP